MHTWAESLHLSSGKRRRGGKEEWGKEEGISENTGGDDGFTAVYIHLETGFLGQYFSTTCNILDSCRHNADCDG